MSENIPANLRYTEQHEWVKRDGAMAWIGITDYAQEALGDITFVELPAMDREVQQGEEIVVVESTKAASDVYAPVSGKIVAVNSAVEDEPERLNDDPFDQGWLVKIEVSDPSQVEALMSAEDYAKHIGSD